MVLRGVWVTNPEKLLDTRDPIIAAQDMADWFSDYVSYAVEPRKLPRLTADRLRRQYGSGNPLDQLSLVRDIIIAFDMEDQQNLATYFCGFPEDVFEMMTIDVPISKSLERLDAVMPPVEPTIISAPQAPVVKTYQAAGAVQAPVVLKVSRPVRPAPRSADDLDNPLSWQTDALCAQIDPEAFFPEKGGSTRAAKAICKLCEVSVQCLAYALESDERFGIWGGRSERERRKLRKDDERLQEALQAGEKAQKKYVRQRLAELAAGEAANG